MTFKPAPSAMLELVPADLPPVRAITPASRTARAARDDVLASLHAARRAANRQRSLEGAREEERGQLLRELGDINERANAVARYRAISPATPPDGIDLRR